MVAHAVHLVLVAAGLAGLGALLAPTLAPRPRANSPRDLHEQRVGSLRAALERYAAGAPVAALAGVPARPVTAPAGSVLLLPLAVSSALVAAGVHAAMVLPHAREGLAVALFFLGCALAQLGWADRALRRPTPTWLVLGAAGNLAVVAVWAVSRTVGLPGREAVGAWDVTAVACELVAAAACLLAVRAGVRRTAPWAEWHPAAHAWLALGTTLLVVLSLGGG
ncbi:hypothetical protein [Nocardioides pyridinolyticus]